MNHCKSTKKTIFHWSTDSSSCNETTGVFHPAS